MAFSIEARLASLVVIRLALPLRADALAETTPGNAVRAFAIRRSQAVHVIPATGSVMSCFVGAFLDVLLVTVMAPCILTDHWPTAGALPPGYSCRAPAMRHVWAEGV